MHALAALGAGILGVATAVTFARQRWARVIAGAILTPGFALLVTVDTIEYLTIAYIAALFAQRLAGDPSGGRV